MQFTEKEQNENIRLLLLLYYKLDMEEQMQAAKNLQNAIIAYIAGTNVLLEQSKDQIDLIFNESKETFFDLFFDLNKELSKVACVINKVFTDRNIDWSKLRPLNLEDLI